MGAARAGDRGLVLPNEAGLKAARQFHNLEEVVANVADDGRNHVVVEGRWDDSPKGSLADSATAGLEAAIPLGLIGALAGLEPGTLDKPYGIDVGRTSRAVKPKMVLTLY